MIDEGIENYRVCVKLAENGPLTNFTPAERRVIGQLGPYVLPMLRLVLNECMDYLERDMMAGEFNRKIFDLSRHLNQIIYLGNRAIKLWCHMFGSVEGTTDSWDARYMKDDEPEHDDYEGMASQLNGPREISKRQLRNTIAKKQGKCLVYLNSSPEAIKMFVICMVTDRIHALDELRNNRRQATGFTSVSLEELPSNATDCPICREALGVRNEQDGLECPVRLVSCCGQYAGGRCLQQWFRYSRDSRCPLCRRIPSPAFFEKLTQFKFSPCSPFDNGEISAPAVEHRRIIREITVGEVTEIYGGVSSSSWGA